MNDIDNLTRGKIHGDESIFVFVIDIEIYPISRYMGYSKYEIAFK